MLQSRTGSTILKNGGIENVVLIGHSNGGNRISHYAETTGDKRFVGLVYLAPSLDSAGWKRAALGADQYFKAIANAEGLAAAKSIDMPHISSQYNYPAQHPRALGHFWWSCMPMLVSQHSGRRHMPSMRIC